MQMPSGDGVTTAGPSFEYVAGQAPPQPWADAPGSASRVRSNGPYIVEGGRAADAQVDRAIQSCTSR